MRKIRKRVFAVVLAAALLFTMPGMASYAEAEDGQTEDISESVTVQAEDDATEETGAETEAMQEPEAKDSDTDQPETGEDDTGDTETDVQEPAEEETVPAQKEDVKECTCGTLCTQDSINGDCPVCGVEGADLSGCVGEEQEKALEKDTEYEDADMDTKECTCGTLCTEDSINGDCSVCGAEDADLSRCEGEKTENSSEENKEDAGQEDTGAQDDSANLCAHHKEHTKDCGYSRASEDGEGSPCTYECRICPIEDLIAALPRWVTEDNRAEVEARLQEILDLYQELSWEEQEQIDLSPCWDLQAALDEANAPVTVDEPAEGAVAQVETDGNISYYDTIDAAWTAANGNTATITLLADVTASGMLTVDNGSTITFEGGSHTLTSGQKTAIQVNGTFKLVSGTIKSTYSSLDATGINVNGTLEMTGGAVTASDRRTSGSMAVKTNSNSNITISGGKISGVYGVYVNDGTVTIENGEISGITDAVYILSGAVTIEGGTFTSSSNGLEIQTGSTVALRGGTFTGGNYAIWTPDSVASLLDESKPYVYFYANGQPVTLEDSQTNLSDGTYTVGECTHPGVKASPNNNGTHSINCSYCGYTGTAEDCAYTFVKNVGTCQACGDALTVLIKPANLIYDGTAKTLEVSVERAGDVLDASEYAVAYDNNTYAGDASVTVIIGNDQGTYSTTFEIGHATPTITWGADAQTLTYTGNPAGITPPTVTLVNGETFSGTINYSYTGTSSGNGLPTNAGTYTIKAKIDAEGNYAGAESANTLTLTINKAQGILTVQETSINKKFGEDGFSLNCSTNGNGKISYASSNESVAAVSADGSILIKGVGEATITISLAEGTNHTGGAKATVTVTVAKANAPAIKDEIKNYAYTNGSNGTVTIDVAGKFPNDRGEAKYTFSITDAKGILSGVSVDKYGNLIYTVLGNKSEGDTASITVTAEMANYENATYTVNIKLVDKKVVEPQAGSSVTISGSNTLTYGQMLSDLKLGNVTFVEQGTGTKVEGTLAWENGSTVPTVATKTAGWIFKPNNTEYAELTGTVAITVTKATPNVETPVAGAVTYNPAGKLDSVGLTGGSATWIEGGSTVDVEGTWNWKDGSVSPAVGNSGYRAVFTPEDTGNYNTVERDVAVTVGKAKPFIEGKVSAAQITYGDSLSKSVLTGTAQYSGSDSTSVPGSFTWKDGTIKPAVSDSGNIRYTVIFTPDEGKNYSSVETEVTLTVEKAENAPNMPSDTMNVLRRCEKVSDVELPSGWQWQEGDKDNALEIDAPQTATAVYVGTDKDNYKNTEVTVTITRSNCDHEKTELRNVVDATCEKEGYSGDTYCTICGELLQKGNEMPTTDHKGGVASCREQAVCEMCKKPYGPYDANHHINTRRRNAVTVSCTAAGNTGDLYCIACGAKVESGKVIPASGHDWQESVIKQPTTSEEGLRRYTCKNCGASREETIPKLPSISHTHSYSVTEARAATCTEAGIKVYSCSCGDSYTEGTPALGHSYHSQMTKAPTVSEEGVMTYTCTRCGHSYTATISRLEAPAPAPGQTPGTGTGNTVRPGTGKEPGSGTAQENRPEPGIPFIKGEDSKTGWDVIRTEEEKAGEGSVINVDMNGTTVVPGDIFDSIKGRDITITFDMGSGIIWSVDGKSVATDKAGDIDFSVKTGVNVIPVDIVNNVTGESYSIQISLAYEGEFGFTAVLSINLGKENAGYTASLYYYNESTGELEFIGSDIVAEDGTASLAFTHASDYVIAIEGDEEEESSGVTEDAQPQPSVGTDESVRDVPESPKTGQAGRHWWIIVAILLAAAIGAGTVLAGKKKRKGENSGQ